MKITILGRTTLTTVNRRKHNQGLSITNTQVQKGYSIKKNRYSQQILHCDFSKPPVEVKCNYLEFVGIR